MLEPWFAKMSANQRKGTLGELQVMKELTKAGGSVNSMTGSDFGYDLNYQLPLKDMSMSKAKSWILTPNVVCIQVKATSGSVRYPVRRIREIVSLAHYMQPVFIFTVDENGQWKVCDPAILSTALDDLDKARKALSESGVTEKVEDLLDLRNRIEEKKQKNEGVKRLENKEKQLCDDIKMGLDNLREENDVNAVFKGEIGKLQYKVDHASEKKDSEEKEDTINLVILPKIDFDAEDFVVRARLWCTRPELLFKESGSNQLSQWKKQLEAFKNCSEIGVDSKDYEDIYGAIKAACEYQIWINDHSSYPDSDELRQVTREIVEELAGIFKKEEWESSSRLMSDVADELQVNSGELVIECTPGPWTLYARQDVVGLLSDLDEIFSGNCSD